MKSKIHEHLNKTTARLLFLLLGTGVLTTLASTNLMAQTSSESSPETPQSEQVKVPLSEPGKPYTLKVGLVSGSIKITSYPGKEIIIEVRSRNKDRKEITEDAGNGMKRISPKNSFDITAKEENNNVTVDNNQPERSIDLNLKIPQDARLKLSTVNSGDIEVDNVKGEIEVNNVNGAIKLTNISGSAVASTVNGNIVATFSAIDPKAPMAFTTLNGNVDVTFPAAAKSSFRLKSERGEIFTDFEVSMEPTPKTEKTTEPRPGLYQIKPNDWVLCKINGGGPEVLMKNMNGNIYIRKAK